MSYIEDLRKAVGSRPLIMVGAGVLLLNQEEQLLLLRRTDNEAWSIPGGAMEPGETLEQTARREMEEETGLVPVELDLVSVFSGPEFFYRYPNGDEVYNVSAVYMAAEVQGSWEIDPQEHHLARFFDLDSLPEPISPPVLPILEYFIRLRRQGQSGKPV
jgi:ADP-ribose pyrophosphatase YjhB (NUDIX family)